MSRSQWKSSAREGSRQRKIERAQRRFGEQVAALRKEKGLTQQELGADCGITTTKMQFIENGRVNVSLSTIVRLGRRLGVKLERLLNRVK
ncbi:MAG TPA: helix-turn-helix transcriptional regulator [Candidatus Angelobacter sp.]